MISIEKALSLIEASIPSTKSTKVGLDHALGRVLSEDLVSPISFPPFAQSAMDGYALKLGRDHTTFKVIGEIKAGDNADNCILNTGEAIKIFTGAMCPASADLVCRIEDIVEQEEHITIQKMPSLGANIRPKGEQIQTGEIAFSKGTLINPASIGYLATLGFDTIPVFSLPKVGVISTGNELIERSSSSLTSGKIYESNGIMLNGALKQANISEISYEHVNDSLESTIQALQNHLSASDLLIITGGISVGDYDFVEEALKQLGVQQVFYKVNQKPGKPLYFGTKGDKLIFALPGNPAAALTCFYVYIWPTLNKLKGLGFKGLPKVKKRISSSLLRPNARAQFLKALIHEDNVNILEGQSSAMLYSLSQANALVYLPSEKTIQTGEQIDALLLP